MCPYCQSEVTVKNGFYLRKSDQKKFKSISVKAVLRGFLIKLLGMTTDLESAPLINYPLNCSVVVCLNEEPLVLLGVKAQTIARRVRRFGYVSRKNLENYRLRRRKAWTVQMDELESFERTKCLPLTVPVIVETKTRKILSLRVGQIAAKGHLARFSKEKCGRRFCERRKLLKEVLGDLKQCVSQIHSFEIRSDDSHHYRDIFKQQLPLAKHMVFKGKRSRSTGQGELKRG